MGTDWEYPQVGTKLGGCCGMPTEGVPHTQPLGSTACRRVTFVLSQIPASAPAGTFRLQNPQSAEHMLLQFATPIETARASCLSISFNQQRCYAPEGDITA